MTNRVYFDQQVLQNNFATFTSNELIENKSIFSLIFSLFSKEEDQEDLSWNSTFSFACDQSGNFAVICVGSNLFLVDFKTNRIRNQIIPNSNSEKYVKSSVAISKESVSVLYDSHVYFYTHTLEEQKEPIKLNIKATKIFCISNNFYLATSSNSFVKLSTVETVLTKLNYTISTSSNSYIALVGKKTITIISKNLTTINPDGSFLNDPQDAIFSANGKLFFILDKNQPNKNTKSEDANQISEVTSNLYIFDSSDGFKLIDTIEIQDSNIRYLSSWVNNHVIVYDDYGSLFFVTLSTHQTQQQPIKPRSILRGTKNGFLMIELEDQLEESFSFNLLSFVSVTPQKLYERSCEQGFFGDALVLMRTFNFNKDTYYKSYVLKSPLTTKLIDEELFMIEDQDWIYNFCCKTIAPDETPEIARKLIKAGLRIRENDEELLKQKERLRIYTQIVKSSFNPNEWKEFRDCNIEQKVTTMAKQNLFQRVGIIFKNSTEITEKTKVNVLSTISPLVHPLKYADLITKDANSFRSRAFFIDDVCGQTSLIVELMKIGSRYIPELKNDFDMAIEFDYYINELSPEYDEKEMKEVDSSFYMKYSDYVNVLNDDQRLLLFAKNSESGLELKERIIDNGKTIIDRSAKSSLEFVLKEPLQNLDSSVVFPTLSMSERIKEIRIILANHSVGSSFYSKYCNEAISSYKYQFTSSVSSSFLENWKNFLLSADIINFLKLANYAATYDKTISYSPLNEIDSSVVINIALKIAKNPEKEWVTFYKFAKNLKLKTTSNSKYIEKLKEINMSAMILMRKFEEIEITTSNERDIAVENVKKLIDSAKSCDINDPMLSGSIQCLAMIPTELKSNVVNSVFKSISLYQHIYKLDTTITPLQVNESNDINSLLISILDSYQFNADDQNVSEKVVKFCELVKNTIKQIDGVDEKIINSYLANLCLKYSNEQQNNECLLLGSEMIGNAFDEIRLKYLKDKRWTNKEKKEKICDDEIENGDKSFLSDVLDFKVNSIIEKEKISTDDFAILDFISKLKNQENSSKIFKFCLDFIQSKNIVQLLKDYLPLCDDPERFNNLVSKLKEEGILNENDMSEFKFNESVIDQIDNVEKQYEMIVKAEKSGSKISNKTKLKVFTLHELNEMKLEYNQTEIVPEKVASFIIESKNKLNSKDCEHVIHLLQVWSNLSLLNDNFNENVLFELIMIVPQKILIENRKLISDILNSEEFEMKFFKKSNNLLFAVTSDYPNVAKIALETDSLSQETIDFIIENKLSYKFADSNHFEDILNRAKSKVQIANIVKSLKDNNKYNALCKLCNVCFGIPVQFTSPKNIDQILNWIDTAIC